MRQPEAERRQAVLLDAGHLAEGAAVPVGQQRRIVTGFGGSLAAAFRDGARTAEKALRIVDGAAREIYFGSGAYGARNRQADDENPVAGTPQLRSRLLREMKPTLTALAQVPYPSVTHHLLETLEAFIADEPTTIFRLVTDALISGGRTGGYQLESLGSDLFVADRSALFGRFSQCHCFRRRSAPAPHERARHFR